MFGHDLNELIVREIFACHMFPISGFFGTKSVLRFQASLLQQLLKLFRRKQFFDVVNSAKVDTFVSQGPLDLPACASRWLFVYDDFRLALRHRLFFLLPRRKDRPRPSLHVAQQRLLP